MNAKNQKHTVARMLDLVLEHTKLKNDAALARALKVAPPVISKIRNGALPLGSSMLVRLHEYTGLNTRKIKALAGVTAT